MLVVGVPFADIDIERGVLAPLGLTVERGRADPAAARADHEDVVALLVAMAQITDDVLSALPAVRIISTYGVGLNHLDLAAAARRGVTVASVPDYGFEEVAAHAVSLALASVRHIAGHDRNVRQGRWDPFAAGSISRLSSLTAGIVGMGRIGRTAAAMLQPFVRNVVAHDPFVPAQEWPAGVTQVPLQELFEQSHVVSLHVPLSPQTAGLVGKDLLARMPAGAHLINTARGGLVDLDALLWALDAGPLGGAALDVLPQEPPPRDHPLLSRSDVTLTPHSAWYSDEAEVDLRTKAARNVASFLETGSPLYPVAIPEPPRHS